MANFSLHIMKNHKVQIAEAYRVLQTGSKAVFTIWGRKENSNLFTIVPDILDKHGFGQKEKPPRTHFTLGENLEPLKNDFESLGFSDIKMWYQPNYTLYKDGEAYFN